MAEVGSMSMPSGYISNLHLSYDERKRIWESLSAERQKEAAAMFAEPATTTSSSAPAKKFSSLGDDNRPRFVGKVDADVSVKQPDLREDTANGFAGLVSMASMTSAIFVGIKQGTDPSGTDASLTDRTKAAFAAAAAKYGGSQAQGMLGYDKNADGYINNESELFGFGERGLNFSDFFTERFVPDSNDQDAVDDSYTTYDLNSVIGTTDTQIDKSRFMLLNKDGSSATVHSSSTDTGSPALTTSTTLNLFSGFRKGTDTAAVTVDLSV